jgi:hypothetical protein
MRDPLIVPSILSRVRTHVNPMSRTSLRTTGTLDTTAPFPRERLIAGPGIDVDVDDKEARRPVRSQIRPLRR